MSVDNTESTKSDVSWEEFPLHDKHVDSMFLKIKEANKNISVLIPVSEGDRSRHIESLYPNREYEVQALLFTGPDFHYDVYSSQIASFTTQQGGTDHTCCFMFYRFPGAFEYAGRILTDVVVYI